mmetsp:Transcript_21275/g.24735  ORF Transcript_21275/g.24735 Transcript_21275/m.24735 type:complete len:118 (-) Transcript_21275:120-473(-)
MSEKYTVSEIQNRRKVARKYLEENPNHVLIELTRGKNSKLSCFSKKHLLSPISYPFYFVYDDLRNRVSELGRDQALYCFINGKVVPRSSDTICELYSKYKGDDDFLHIEFSEINSYG